ncbi:MAG: hypothetical protein H6825_02480 [Planctomycetes bacterium]|nr:hypothetical protein [Planctomycetota bacterium]
MDEVRTGPSCVEVRHALCRLAVGERLRARGREFARHVRGCDECDAFVDELALVRRWLDAHVAPRDLRVPPRELERRARLALAGELAARLARDLLAVSRGRDPRPPAERRRDVERLHLLRAEAWLRTASGCPTSTWLAARAVLAFGREERPGQALELAARLDPHGLDVGLAWLGQLVRVGCEREANRVAERLLADVHG